MKQTILTLAAIALAIFSAAALHAERQTQRPDPPFRCKAHDCECDSPIGCPCASSDAPCFVKDTSRFASQWGANVGGKIAPDGKTELQIDLPGSQHLRNKGGNDRTRLNPRGEPGKGSGLCVFTSIEHAARWANVTSLIDFRDWMTTKPGGGWPQKVDAMIAEKCKQLGVQPPEYIQLQGGRELLDILRSALASNRMIGVTYSFSPTGRYGGAKIAHMVNLVHLDSQYACVLDNNEPGEDKYEWMSVEEFVRTFTNGRAGWAVILLDRGPPPFPFN